MKKENNNKELISRFQFLSKDENYPDKKDKVRRGREFEKLIRDMLSSEGLSPRANSFRSKGEELDGSFRYAQKTYLLEAKWHADPLPASSIYQFKGKVDGKLVGTIGIFISMSGFSNDCIDALIYGKSLNVILFDGKDFERCIHQLNGFSLGLEEKLRAATETGLPYFSLNPVSIKPLRSKRIPKNQILSDIVIVVEGQGDQEIITFIAEQILKENNIERKLMIRTAGGKLSVPRLASAIDDFKDIDEPTTYKYILVADADADAEETAKLLSKDLNESMLAIFIIPDPEIEIWFQQFKIYDREDLKNYARDHNTKPSIARSYLLNRLDLTDLIERDNAFRKFYEALIT